MKIQERGLERNMEGWRAWKGGLRAGRGEWSARERGWMARIRCDRAIEGSETGMMNRERGLDSEREDEWQQKRVVEDSQWVCMVQNFRLVQGEKKGRVPREPLGKSARKKFFFL